MWEYEHSIETGSVCDERRGESIMSEPRYWVGVVSREHVQGGVRGSFAQLCHGKERPLRRMRHGDWLIYYSPRTQREGGAPVQAFTAIGRVEDDRVYAYAMSESVVPYRRGVRYLPCREAPIVPLLDRLTFITNKQRWGYPFRTGHFEISKDDFVVIAAAMGVDHWAISEPASA